MVRGAILITGASKGLGFELTKLLSKENLVFAIASSKKEKINEELLKNPNVIYESIDLSNKNSIEKIIDLLGIKYKINVLIHNAAILSLSNCLTDLTYEEIEKIIKINTIAPIYLNSILVKNQLFLDRAKVLNIGSKAAHIPFKKISAYSISKSGLYMAHKIFQNELKTKGIYFGSVMPGVMDTQMNNDLKFKGGIYMEEKNILKTTIVAKFIKFIVSNKVSGEEFEKEEWDIYDRKHHHLWNINNEFIPLNAPQFFYN